MREPADQSSSFWKKRVAITGLGIISPLGIGVKAVWDAAIRQKTNLVKERFRLARGKIATFYFHKVKEFALDSIRLPRNMMEAIDSWKLGRIDEDLLWAVAAAQLAIQDSRLEYDRDDNEIGLFVSHENPGLELFFDRTLRTSFALLTKRNGHTGQRDREAFIEDMYQRCVADGYDAQTFVYLYLIGKALGVHGFTCYSCNACASGLYALELAAREIWCGRSPVAIVVASDHPRYLYKFLWFQEQGLYAPDGLIKPFDRQRDGFSIGDGAAAIILEAWEHAKGRRAAIYAEYLGGGFGAQGWKVTVPDLSSRAYVRSIAQALDSAGLIPEDIDVLVPHGVGTGVGDAYEARAINEVFGPPEKQPPVTALKPYIGHTLGGSALMETILAILCMKNGTIIPTLNSSEPDPALSVHLVTQPLRCRSRFLMKAASGFAGYDGSVIFKNHPVGTHAD